MCWFLRLGLRLHQNPVSTSSSRTRAPAEKALSAPVPAFVTGRQRVLGVSRSDTRSSAAQQRPSSPAARATEQAFVCRIPRSLDDVQFQAVCTRPMGDTRGKRSENKSKTGGWPWKYVFLCKTVYSRKERARYNSLSCHRDQTPFSLCLVRAFTARHKTFCRKVLPAKMLKCFYFRQKNKAFEGPEKKPLSDQTSQHPLEKGLGSLSPAPIS